MNIVFYPSDASLPRALSLAETTFVDVCFALYANSHSP